MTTFRRFGVLSLVAFLAGAACSAPGTSGSGPLVQARQVVVVGPPATPGVDGPLGVTTIDTPAPVWEGGPPAQRTTAEIMADAAQTPPSRQHWSERPRARKLRPNREDLPQNPLALPLARHDAPALLERGGVPSVAQTATTPNADVANIVDTQALPPDTMGDIGPTQYLLGLNGRIRSIAKATGVKDNAVDADFDVFFPTGLRAGAGTSDPRVRYDRRTGRWFVLMITVAVPNRFLVAVSNGSTITPSTVWAQHQWTNTRTQGGVGGAASCLADYPTLGIDEDALYVGVNQFCGPDVNSLGFDSTSAFVLNKSALVSGTLAVAQFDAVLPNGNAFGMYTPQGVDNLDANTNEGYFIAIDNRQFGNLILRRVSSPTASPTLSGDLNVAVAATEFPEDVPHPGSLTPLDGLDDRLLQAVIRGGRLWTTHQIAVNASGVAVSNGGRTGIRWYELGTLGPTPATPSLVQSGTMFDGAASSPVHYWMGAIMPNGQGHVALGMSKAGATTRVNTAFTGRLAGDPAGAMDLPTQYSGNTSFAYNQQGAPDPSQRWGDYSYTSVDPDDDMTFWTLQQYVNGTNSYAVRLLRMLAPAPAAITTVSPSTVAPGQANVVVNVTGSAAGGRGFFDPGAGFSRRLAASFSGGGVAVTNVVVNSPTSLTLTLNTSGATAGARTLTVTNPDGQIATLASAITVGTPGANQAPIIVGAPTDLRLFDAGVGVSTGPMTFTVIDPDSQPVTLTATSSNTTVIPQTRVQVSLAGTVGTLTLSSAGSFGSSTITISASDGALTTTVTFVVTVSPSSIPGPPQNLVGVVARNRVTFTWDQPATAATEPVTGYRLEGGTFPGETIAVIPLGTAQTYTIFNAPSGVFFLRVRAQTAAGLGPVSNEVVVATGEAAPPLAPLALLATVQNTALELQWTENPLGPVIAGYRLHAGSGPGLSDIGVLPLPPTARSFAANAPPGIYYVRVHAVNAAGVSVASNEALLVAQPGTCTIPNVPLGLAASVTGRRLTLQWNAPLTGAIPTTFTIQAGTTSGAANWGTFGFPATATTVSGIVPPGPYFIRLFAGNNCGTSAASTEVSATVQ